jgi:hypothetical protein
MSDASKPKGKKTGGGYAVGYGKPPKSAQFKPGHSGNPNGRPKGQPTTQQLLLQEAAKMVKVKIGDDIVQLSKHQAIIRKLYIMALEGNVVALRLILSQLGSAELAQDQGEIEPPLTDAELAMAAVLGLKLGGGENG